MKVAFVISLVFLVVISLILMSWTFLAGVGACALPAVLAVMIASRKGSGTFLISLKFEITT